jgi:hypothetical protein
MEMSMDEADEAGLTLGLPPTDAAAVAAVLSATRPWDPLRVLRAGGGGVAVAGGDGAGEAGGAAGGSARGGGGGAEVEAEAGAGGGSGRRGRSLGDVRAVLAGLAAPAAAAGGGSGGGTSG